MSPVATDTATAPSHGRGSAADQGARIRAQAEEKRKSLLESNRTSKKVDAKGWGMTDDEEERLRKKEAARKLARENERKSAIVERQRAKEEAAAERRRIEKVVAEAREEELRKEKALLAEGQINGGGEEGLIDEKQVVDHPAKIGKSGATVAEEEKPKRVKSSKTTKAPTTSKDAEKAAVGVSAVGAAEALASRKEPKLEKKGRSYPVSGIDNLALLMEGDKYQTTCFSVYMFRTELDSETLTKFFDKLTSSYPKYNYVVELDPSIANKKEKARKSAARKGEAISAQEPSERDRLGRRTRYSHTLKAGGLYRPAQWRYDENFHFQDNITELEECPDGGKDEKALFDLAGTFLSEHFDYSKPLWKALCVRGLDTSEGAKSALMIKVHHALSDGQGMIMSYHTALAAMEHGVPIEGIQAQVDSRTKSGEQKKPGQRNIRPTIWGTTKHGFHTFRGLYLSRRQAFEYSSSERTNERFYCHSDGIPMADIKLVRDVFSDSGLDLSLNDVACAVLSRALRMAAEATSTKKVTDKRIAVFVPISLRPANNWELANYTTGGIAWFRFHDPSKVSFKEQLSQVHREMNRIKRSHWPKVWFNLFGTFSKHRALFVPNYPVGKQFLEATYREYHVATNLPGPSKPIQFGTHKAYSYHVLPPSSPGKSTLSIGMISYADDFSLAVSCDGAKEFKQTQLARVICQSFQDAALELVEAAKAESRKNGAKEPSTPST
ncbi:hypothetical protein CBS101457_002387 [Exobasidium rhododendri]|nr:hypothetical protein CBS101457_002387 [Exobasidium rhododendri]